MTELEAARAEIARLEALLRHRRGAARPAGPSYAACWEFRMRLPSDRAAAVSRSSRWARERIAALPIDVGRALDAAGFGFAILRYVASSQGMFERELRYRQVMTLRRLPDRPLRADDLTAEERAEILERWAQEADEAARQEAVERARWLAVREPPAQAPRVAPASR
jgi:hypothetical protein